MRVSIEFSFAAIMALILYFAATKNSPFFNIVLLLALFGFCLHPALRLHWVADAHPLAVKLRRSLAVVALTLIAVSCFGIWVWPPSPIPHIQAILVVDSVSGSDLVAFHIHVRNIGSVGISDPRWRSQNEKFASQEGSLELPRTLPPGGELDIHGFPGVFTPNITSSLTGALTYTLDTDPSRSFFSMYRFTVLAEKPSTFSPDAWMEKEGLPESAVTSKSVEAQWQATQGTLYFGLDEARPDGHPNVITMQDARKKFTFDPGTAEVVFIVTADSGKTLKFQHKLQLTGARHFVAFGWDKTTAFLMVDGLLIASS